MKPVERLGFGPTRVEVPMNENLIAIRVTPPAFMGLPTQMVILNKEQYDRYQQWRSGDVLIQDALFDLNDNQREILMTGIGDADFKRIAGEDEEEV